MAMYVYKDVLRTQTLWARNAQKEDKGTQFYCPNHNCGAHMHICNLNGVSASYFKASSSYGHIDGCAFGSSNGFDPNKYNEDKFYFEDALSALMESSERQGKKETPYIHKMGTTNINSKSPHTIRQIYTMCKSYDFSDSYNGQSICQMLVDNRSIHMYSNGVFGWRIIEGACKSRIYDNDKKEIFLVVSNKDRNHKFVLSFNDKSLFYNIKNDIYNNKDKIIVVAAKWSAPPSHDVSYTDFKSKKQLAIIK